MGARGSLGFDGQCETPAPASTRLSSWGESELFNNNNEDEDEEGWIDDDDFQAPGDGENTEDQAIKND